MFSKILVPLDGSEHSLKALEEAVQIAKKFSGKITLIHVYSVQPIKMPEPSTVGSLSIPIITGAEVSTMIEAAKKLGNRILDDVNKGSRLRGFKSKRCSSKGTPLKKS